MKISEELIEIIEKLSLGEEFSISSLLGEKVHEFSFEELFQIYSEVLESCKNRGINLECKSKNKIVGMPYSMIFVKNRL